jgi:hypothetical protein
MTLDHYVFTCLRDLRESFPELSHAGARRIFLYWLSQREPRTCVRLLASRSLFTVKEDRDEIPAWASVCMRYPEAIRGMCAEPVEERGDAS